MKRILRVEALVLFVILLATYQVFQGDWLIFIGALFLFDVSMIGYLKDNKLGTITYNLGHSYALPSLLLLVSYYNEFRTPFLLAVIWLAHISLDRSLGYGLKLDSFKNTHLGKIGGKANNSK